MATNEHSDTHSVAIDQLESFGLSAYAARTLVALVAIEDGTAEDVSEVAEVPRTRVYDAVDELESFGLVEVQESTPKRFWAVSVETICKRFRREYATRVDELNDALSELATTVASQRQRGVWTLSGRQQISKLLREFIDGADDELVYVAIDRPLRDELVDRLDDAGGRGVSITLAGSPEAIGTVRAGTIPNVDLCEWRRTSSDTPAGRLLLVDDDRTLVSVGTADSDEDADPPPPETAIWTDGHDDGIGVVIRTFVEWQLGQICE